jgi:hypothetical protein
LNSNKRIALTGGSDKVKKLFVIELNENSSPEYEQYDGFVVRADNEEVAWKLAEKAVKCAPYFDMKSNYFKKDNFSIKEINADGDDEIILASYNAG